MVNLVVFSYLHTPFHLKLDNGTKLVPGQIESSRLKPVALNKR